MSSEMPIIPSAKRTVMQTRAKPMNILSWDAEDWRFAFEVVSIAAGVLTAAALIGMAVAGQIARSNARREAAKAEAELERVKKAIGPRQINREVFVNALEGQPKAPVQILYLRDDQESLEFAQEIANLLERAKWKVIARQPIPIPKRAKSAAQDIPITMTVGGQPSGVTVVTHSVTEEEIEAGKRVEGKQDWIRTPWTVLCNAFEESTGVGQAASNETVPKGTLRVVVAPKPVK
jgi:hypothetical protein